MTLPLTTAETQSLKKHKAKKSELLNFATDELEVLLSSSAERAREIRALAEFQTIPSVGIKFAEDLVFMGYYSIDELKGKTGAALTDAYEQKKGYWIDSCVEDQFRLVVHYANTRDPSLNWWDFTKERKAFRESHGYPDNRPEVAWHSLPPENR